ncbi:hypothetical protein S40293_02805 [Stachybotrys chartarum IBT 40293]|nr:hypothetical protein S40293_02805 [Stachybotrys chartarum IBT 40293]
MPRTEDAPASGAAPIPVPGATKRRPSSAQLDLVSRSLPTAGPLLEPEAPAFTMMPPSRVPDVESGDSADGDDRGDDETSPLLRTASSPSSYPHGPATRRFWLILGQVLLTHFVACFDSTVMASSHPVITSDFGAAHSASWLSTAFLLTSTAAQPPLGRLSDALGRKPLVVGCLVVFAGATVWCALAGSIESFILARAACGVGAGGSMTLGAIILSDLLPIECVPLSLPPFRPFADRGLFDVRHRQRPTYQSYVNVVYGIGSALGAALGGAMAEALGWRWEFGIQVPVLLLCLVVSQLCIPSDLGLQAASASGTVWEAFAEFDFMGSVLLTVSVTFFILGLNLGGNVLPWSHPFVIASLCIFTLGFPAFLWVETTAAKPIMPLRIVQAAPRANLIFSNVLAAVMSNAIIFNIPLYFQAVLLSSATDSGLRLVVPTVVASFTGAMTGFGISRTRRLKWPVFGGTIFYFIGTTSLALLRRDLPQAVYLLALVPFAIGQGAQFPGTFLAVLATSEQSEQAVVTSTLVLWRSLGMVLGVAASSLVVQNGLLHYLNLFVEGDQKDDVIRRVRGSVEAVAGLQQPYQEQVVMSYEAALRLTFISCAVVGVISVFIAAPMKLPRLPARKK